MNTQVDSMPPAAGTATENKLFWRTLSCLIPVGALAALYWLDQEMSPAFKLLVAAAALGWIVGVAVSIRHTFIHQMRTLNNLIETMRTKDCSLRGTLANESGAVAEPYQPINLLKDQLQQSGQDERDLRDMLARIITQLNVAVVAYDSQHRIVLVNHLAERLLALESAALIGKAITDFQLEQVVPVQTSHLIEHIFPGARGRWQITRQEYNQHGQQGCLLFIEDLEQMLSEQGIKAWQRLIRIIAHEVNNSLTPITSLCQTLRTILHRQTGAGPNAASGDVLEGLEIINERALNLKNFIADYARIARLPDAQKSRFDLLALIAGIRTIYHEDRIELNTQETAVPVSGDQTQIEQVLINVLKNAIEATADKTKEITITVRCSYRICRIEIMDQGPGLSNQANLFVPFYTTKPLGAGIGLALSRRIVAAHNGDLQLQNRDDGISGAVATLILPLAEV